MTDDSTQLDKWSFPSLSIAAGAYLIVYASDKSPTSLDGGLHTNFILNKGGEYLALIKPDLSPSHVYPAYPAQKKYHSYGLVPGTTADPHDPANARILSQPTPGASNSAPLFIALDFSVESRYFFDPFSVTLNTPIPGAEIRFTSDGSEPNISSPLYTGAISISVKTTLKAKLFFSGGGQSETVVHRYYKMATALQSVDSDLPILIIDTDGQSIGSGNKTASFSALIEPNASIGRTSLGDLPSFAGRVGYRIRGSSSGGFPKKQFSMELWDEQGEDLPAPLLDLPEESDWVLYAPGRYDRSRLNNMIMYDLSNRIGRYAPRTRFVEVYLNTGGGDVDANDYWGMYIIVEKIKRDADRVDVEKLDPSEISLPEIDGGYMLSVDRSYEGQSRWSTSHQSNLNHVYPKWTQISNEQRDYIRNYLNAFDDALYGPNWTDPDLGYAQYFDIPASIDHHILKCMAHEVDMLRLSTYMYKSRGGKLTYGPVWDFDRALQSTDSRDDNPEGWSYYRTYSWWPRLFSDPEFDLAWWDRWYELRQNELSTPYLNALIDSVGNLAAEAVQRDNTRWVSNGYGFRYGGYAQEIQAMQNWLQLRCEWIDSEFIAPPDFSLKGGVVVTGFVLSLSNPNNAGDIYYTLDGSDPREFGGALSANAQLYNSPITLGGSGVIYVTARVKDGNSWGAKRLYGYILPQDHSGLTINEIHYHPADSLSLEGDSFEFIELYYQGSSTLNLGGLKFGEGVDFIFPPGTLIQPDSFYVIAQDEAHFESLYGFSPDGIFNGSLANSGESLELLSPSGQVIDLVPYDDKLPWATAADGLGPSLELSSPSLDNALAGSWEASVPQGGTPKAANSRFCDPSPPNLIINEIQYNYDAPLGSLEAGDWLELHNPNTTSLDLSDWQIQDQQNVFLLPAGANIPANGYAILASDPTAFAMAHPTANLVFGPLGFNLNNGGEQLILSSDQGCLVDALQYSDQSPWPQEADGSGESLALADPNTDNADPLAWFASHNLGGTPQMANTSGLCDSAALNYLVINEINYHSPAALDPGDWVEIYNPYPYDIDLSGWEFHNDDHFFKIPAFTIISAQSYLVLAENLFAFQAIFPSVSPVIGDFAFSLDNDGETLALLTAERCLVDMVDYGDRLPWVSLPDGLGPSLALIAPSADNQNPANWQSSSLGGANFGSPGQPNNLPDPCTGLSSSAREIVINEISYNASLGFDAGNWLELHNPSPDPIDLSQWQLHDSDTAYLLPNNTWLNAGEYLVLAEEVALFNSKYPSVNNVIGNLGFGFSNQGERLLLYSQSACLIDSVNYDDKTPWPSEADGDGPSIELDAPNLDNALAQNWSASDGPGTPGQDNSLNPCLSLTPIVINELYYHGPKDYLGEDWVELYNPSSAALDLSAWIIRDEQNFFILPVGTSIAANGYLVISTDTFAFRTQYPSMPAPLLGDLPFGFAKGGEHLRLYNAAFCLVDSLTYDDKSPWPIGPDGYGPSLSLVNPLYDNALGQNWAASPDQLGTPGLPNDMSCNPGGERKHLKLWLRADQGSSATVDGDLVNTWQGQGPNAEIASGGATYKLDQFNGNPTLHFNGSNQYFDLGDSIVPYGNSNYSVFTVYRPTQLGSKGLLGSGNYGSDNQVNAFRISGSGQIFNYWWANDLVSGANQVEVGKSYLTAFLYDNQRARSIEQAGLEIAIDAQTNRNSSGFNNQVGRTYNNEFWAGDIAEMIVMDAYLPAYARWEVESYLALKYGFTIPVSHHLFYDHESFPFDLAGLGKDDTRCLLQNQGRNISGDDILQMRQASSLDHGDYLVWGHDNAPLTEFYARYTIPDPYTLRLSRTWRVQSIGEIGTVEVRFDLTGLGLSSDPQDFALLQSQSANFTNANVRTGASFDGDILVFTNVAFSDAAHFSLATRRCLNAPIYTYFTAQSCDPALIGLDTTFYYTKQGCDSLVITDWTPAVNALTAGPGGLRCNLSAWLQADSGLVFDNAEVSLWQDQGLADNHASSSLSGKRPVLSVDSLNGHQMLYFDGTDDWLKLNGLADELSANASIFAVFIPRADNDDGYYLSAHNGGSNRVKYGHRPNGELIYDDDSPSLSTDIWLDIPLMVSLNQATAAARVDAWVNGQLESDWTGFSTASADRVSIGQEFDGSGNDNQTSNHWKGDLAELIVFDTLLWTEGRHRIESYLALKYGLTIPANSHLYYHYPAHANHQVGIAKDSTQGLDQEESRSALAGSILKLKATEALEQADFLVMGHNGASASANDANTNVPIGMLDRMARVWRISEQGETHTLHLSFDLNGLAWTIADKRAWVLMVDDDGNFEDARLIEGIAGDSLVFAVDLAEGEYISLGRRAYREVKAQAILSGAYDIPTAMMRDDLRQKALIPLVDPYIGERSVKSDILAINGDSALVDWVLLELRSAVDSQVVSQKPALLQRDGDIVDVDGQSSILFFADQITDYQQSDSFFLAIRHRNHLGVMSSKLRYFDPNEAVVDFRQGNNLWGNDPQQSLTAGIYGLWSGDANGSGAVIFQGGGNDPSEVFIKVLSDSSNVSFARNYILEGYLDTDLNLDGSTIFQGGGSDVSTVFINVLSHPANTSFNRNYVISASLP
ncbi:MAG: lamin tail domain-containing protein [Bacteroidota bacterium]